MRLAAEQIGMQRSKGLTAMVCFASGLGVAAVLHARGRSEFLAFKKLDPVSLRGRARLPRTEKLNFLEKVKAGSRWLQ